MIILPGILELHYQQHKYWYFFRILSIGESFFSSFTSFSSSRAFRCSISFCSSYYFCWDRSKAILSSMSSRCYV